MNLHALNEVPVNGWATWLGFGSAGMSLSVSGRSANVHRGVGAAQLAAQASGQGVRLAMASGAAGLSFQATGDGTRRVLGDGLGLMVLDGIGDGRVTHGNGGTITMVLAGVNAAGGIVVDPTGDAQIELRAEADGRAATGRHGQAHALAYLLIDPWGRVPESQRGSALAQVWLNPYGGGHLIAQHGGAARMSLAATAHGRTTQRAHGFGSITMRMRLLRQETRQYRQVNGAGAAALSLDMRARDRRVATLHDGYTTAPRLRTLWVPHEIRTLRVPREDRELVEA